MNIKKVVASSLLALSIVPNICAMAPERQNMLTNFFNQTAYHAIRNREMSIPARLENIVCPNDTITHKQLSFIHKLVMTNIAHKKPKKGYDYELISLDIWNNLENRTCNGRLDSFVKLYLEVAESLHLLSLTYRDRTNFQVYIASFLIGELKDKNTITFDELKQALFKTLRREIVNCL